MEELKYIIEDSTIAELLGIQNFSNDESAVLELVKNAYDAGSKSVVIQFDNSSLTIIDDGIGMNVEDIKKLWMHVGYSSKTYETTDENNRKRILAGSKGVGRFALARLGSEVCVYSKKNSFQGVVWKTDWNNSTISVDNTISETGTKIVIKELREKWTKRKVEKLIVFLSKTYNDDAMEISIVHPDITTTVSRYFSSPDIGNNCLSLIKLNYDSKMHLLRTEIISDEFLADAEQYCTGIDLTHHKTEDDMLEELKSNKEWENNTDVLTESLTKLGDFSAEFYFAIKPTRLDMEKFLYKHSDIIGAFPEGIVLYRNAFSISSYEGKKDWLGLGKRSRKSPAAATHPTGSWRVRENQISGKVEIDKNENNMLQDLSNRQGLDENVYYELFLEVILTGIKEFERYRQSIIRCINQKNTPEEESTKTPIIDKLLSEPKYLFSISNDDAKQLLQEIKDSRKDNKSARKEKEEVENRYKYDVRILNVLATVGLKASSIAHEMRNDRNAIAEDTDSIITALKEFDMWDELNSPDRTEKAHSNVPYLLGRNKATSTKLVAFMNTMLSEIEKKQFKVSYQSVYDIVSKISRNWEKDYAWITISIDLTDDIVYNISEDILQVILDNLILNSVQQNDKTGHLDISISVKEANGLLAFVYKDNGCGLAKKYLTNPLKILEVHETTRPNGHGLGMWIVNNTAIMSGGSIIDIKGQPGFTIEFTVGGKM